MVDLDALLVLVTVIGIDLALSADNAVVIGLVASTLPAEHQNKVIAYGTIASAVLRMVLSVFAVHLLGVMGLVLAGGLLLLYVAWKLWWDLKNNEVENPEIDTSKLTKAWTRKTLYRAIVSIVIADLSMSIENILAVAGAARNHITIMMIGLGLSVVMTGFAASLISKLLDRQRWIGYLGVILIIWVALQMIWDGSRDVLIYLGISIPII